MGSDCPIDRVLGALEGVERHNGYFRALCPAHDDHSPSLDIKEVGENDQKKVILKCQAGCETAAVLEKVGLEWKDLPNFQAHREADEEHSDMFLPFLAEFATGEREQLALQGVQESLHLFTVYRGGVADAMEKLV